MEETAISVPSSIWTSLNGWFTSSVFFILLNVMIATIVFTSNLPTNNNQQPNNLQQEEEEQEDNQQHQKQKHDSNNNQPQVTRSPSILNRIKSFNFSQISPPGSDPDTHYQENPLEVAATQFVFNQPLHYQHFDFDPVNPGEEMETDRIHFEFDPTQKETGTTRFDYDLVNSGQETERGSTHFDFETTREEREMAHFDFDPTHEVTRQDSGFEEETDEFESLDDVYSKLKSGGGHLDSSKSVGEIPSKPAATKMRKSASMKVSFSNTESEEKVEARRPATSRKAAAAAVDEDEVHEDDVEVDAKADDFINKFKNDLKLQRIESIMKKNGGKK